MVPYHLRTGKYVDRALFVDLLMRLANTRPIHEYTYVGLGGPFLDDFRLLHRTFGFRQMLSIESNPKVVQRQEFNRPCTSVKLHRTTTTEFLAEFSFDTVKTGLAMWLDYTSPHEYEEQFEDALQALRSMSEGDIFRITFNIDRASLKADGDNYAKMSEEQKAKRRLEVLRGKMGSHYPREEIPLDTFKGNCDLSRVFLDTLQRVAANARSGSRAKFHHLMSLRYSDTTQMLTTTGIVLTEPDAQSLLRTLPIANFEFVSSSPIEVFNIGAPILSTAERLFIERRLPTNDLAEICERLPFLEEAEVERLQRYFRYLPHFQRSSTLV